MCPSSLIARHLKLYIPGLSGGNGILWFLEFFINGSFDNLTSLPSNLFNVILRSLAESLK